MSKWEECRYLDRYEGKCISKDEFAAIYSGMKGESFSYEDLKKISKETSWKEVDYGTSYRLIFLKLTVAYFEAAAEEYIVMRHIDHIVIKHCLAKPSLFYTEERLYMTDRTLPAMAEIALDLEDMELSRSVQQASRRAISTE